MSCSNIFNRKGIESESFSDRFRELSIQEICQLSPKKTGSEQLGKITFSPCISMRKNLVKH